MFLILQVMRSDTDCEGASESETQREQMGVKTEKKKKKKEQLTRPVGHSDQNPTANGINCN